MRGEDTEDVVFWGACWENEGEKNRPLLDLGKDYNGFIAYSATAKTRNPPAEVALTAANLEKNAPQPKN